MAEYRNQILLGAVIVIVLGVSLVVGVMYLPSGLDQSNGSSHATDTNPPLMLSSSKQDQSWNLTVTISADSVSSGKSINLIAKVTNIASTNQTIGHFVEPIINPAVFNLSGTQVWAWDPPQAVFPNTTITSKQTISQNLTIPIQLPGGQEYSIVVSPLFDPSLTITMEFVVT